MKVYLCDHTFNRDASPRSAWDDALQTAFGGVYEAGLASNDNEPPNRHAGYSNPKAVIFVHTEYTDQWVRKAAARSVKCNIMLVRSNGGEGERNNTKGNLHGCYWSPQQVNDLTNSDVQNFINAIKAL